MKYHSKKVGAIALALALSASTGIASLVASADGTKKYTNAYDSWEEVLADGAALNVEIASEGFVLLKNEKAALPLAETERNVTLLGSAAYTIQSGGGGSGGLSRPNASFATSSASNIVTSLTNEGFKINPRVQAKYGNGSNADSNKYMDVLAEGEGLVEFGGEQYAMAENCFLAGADDNFTRYGDVAIINLLRTGSEGYDNLAYKVSGHEDENEHYMTLRDSEREILAYAKYHKEVVGDIGKIVVIVNSPSVMEIADIQDDDAFDSILWIGTTGWNGADVIGKVLTGEVNPSGHTVDFWMSDIKTDPTYYNFSNNNQIQYLLTGKYGTLKLGSGNTNAGENVPMGHADDAVLDNHGEVLSYSEGIFMGYRYYESVAADIGGEAGEAWYQSVTTYPFGYGLSYTTFEQEIVGVDGDLANANGEVTVTVKVTNTGKVAGKDVVQLYNTPEYHDGGIDKAEVNLVGFTKTDIIKAGKSQTVKVTIAVKDLAEFDYNDANENKNSGYELEEGKYVLSIRKNSHEVYDTVELQAGELLTWDEDGDPTTPNNIFSQEEGVWEMYNTSASHWTVSGEDHDLHRNTLLNEAGDGPSNLLDLAWTLTDDNVFTDEAFNVLLQRDITATSNDFDNPVTLEKETDYTNVWTKYAEDMEGLTQGTGVKDEVTGLYDITVMDMIGVDYDDEKWDTFLNQLTWKEITGFIRSGGYSTAALASVGKAAASDNDGPQQLKGRGAGSMGNGWAWVSSPVIASTWNVDLCYEQGKLVGIESMWQGGLAWYAPAMNNQRNPLSGRNFEYYSQDGIQGGLIAAAIVKGATDQGMRVYIKHAFLNDQETSRFTAETLVNEQALRQIYAKPFELAIKKGNANGIMASFNNIGLQSSASYAVNIQLYTNEWGYKGATVTDFYMSQATCGWWNYAMIRGCVFPLGNATELAQTWDDTAKVVKDGEKADYTTWYWARETAKRLLYVYANSNTAKNGFIATKALAAANVSGETNNALALKVIDTEYLTNVFGKSGYTLTATNLPEGLTINNKGEIAGTATQTVNNANVTITIQGANGMAWIGGSVNTRLTLTEGVAPLPAQGVTLPEAGLTATYNTAYEQTASVYGFITEGEGQNWYPNVNSASAAYVDKYIGAATYAATGLPKGLSINRNTGVISGTPTEVGEFEVTLTATMKQVYAGNSNRYQTRNVNFSTTYTITVGGGYNVTVVDQFGTTYLVQATATGEAFDIATINVANFKAPGAGMTAKYVSLKANGEAATGTLTEATTLYVVWEFPDVTLIDGEWWIHGENSGIQAAGQVGAPGEAGEAGAAGQDGKDGKDGADGETPTIEINADGYWVINGEVTNVKAAGEQGPQGEAGVPGQNGAPGKDGKDGADGKDFLAGCSSVIGVGSVAMIALLGAAYIVRRKENN